MENTIQTKLKEYKEHIETLKGIDELEVYNWMMSLGAKLNDDALSEDKRTIDNKIKQCQFDLYVDKEDNKLSEETEVINDGDLNEPPDKEQVKE